MNFSYERKMIEVEISRVPEFLRVGEFYRGFLVDDMQHDMIETILVPLECYKADPFIGDASDLALLLQAILFWVLDKWPRTLLEYCSTTNAREWESTFIATLGDHYQQDWLHRVVSFFKNNHISVEVVAEIKRSELMEQWMRRNSPDSEEGLKAVSTALKSNNYQLLNYLRIHGYGTLDDDFFAAITAGDLGKLKKLLKTQRLRETDSLSVTWSICAAENGQLDCLKYLRRFRCPADEDTCTAAAVGNHLACLRFLHEKGCPWDDTLTMRAAASGSSECLEFALYNGCPLHRKAGYCAASEGHVACVDVIINFTGELDVTLMSVTARNSNLDLLRYLFEVNCPYGTHEVQGAAASGCTNAADCVQFLVNEQLLPFDELVYSVALYTSNVSIVQYLVDAGCPCNYYPVDEVVFIFAVPCDADILKCIRYSAEHGWPINAHLVAFVFSRDLPRCQEYLQTEGFSCPQLESSDNYVSDEFDYIYF